MIQMKIVRNLYKNKVVQIMTTMLMTQRVNQKTVTMSQINIQMSMMRNKMIPNPIQIHTKINLVKTQRRMGIVRINKMMKQQQVIMIQVSRMMTQTLVTMTAQQTINPVHRRKIEY